MEWNELNEYTVMHMMGYGQSIWTVDIFREAYENDDYICPTTLVWLCEYYVKQWGTNTQIEEVLAYLNGIDTKEELQ